MHKRWQSGNKCFMSRHALAGTESGVEAAIYCEIYEIWFGVGMVEQDQN